MVPKKKKKGKENKTRVAEHTDTVGCQMLFAPVADESMILNDEIIAII